MDRNSHLDNYLKKVPSLADKFKEDASILNQLLDLIETACEACGEDSEAIAFYRGEYAFYGSKYKRALKHYLQAKNLPNIKFFCYRSLAYASKEGGDLIRAKEFAQKALAMDSNDYTTMALLDELSRSDILDDKIEDEEQILDVPRHNQIEEQHSHVATVTMEPSMFSQPDMFIGNDGKDQHPSHQLFKRLYPEDSAVPYGGVATCTISDAAVSMKSNISTLNQLKRFSASTAQDTATYCGAEGSLAFAIDAFNHKEEELTIQYLNQFQSSAQEGLYVLHGQPKNLPSPLLADAFKSSGGFFIRWEGKGIVINPGKDFFEYFHRQGLHIRDIDYVIVTGDNPESYSDIQAIYALNYRLNKISSELQVIHYYLSQKAYQALARTLKPNFKQERNTVHCLELFVDSPEVEKVELAKNIILHYFALSAQESTDKAFRTPASLGICLELASEREQTTTIRLGYISGASWTSKIEDHLGSCDLLIAGFGRTNEDDYKMLDYIDGCLGFFGTFSLLSALQPRLLLCSEFNGNNGDIRLEALKFLRQQYNQSKPEAYQASVILPADNKLFVDLRALQVRCSTTNKLVPLAQVRVVRTHEGNLDYIAPSCYL